MPRRKLTRMLEQFDADAIHISTEGPLGQAARKYCCKRGLRFTTAYHTRFPEYVRLRIPVPLAWTYSFVRSFHNSASITMFATPSLENELNQRGFKHLRRWNRGVYIDLLRPRNDRLILGISPIAFIVGRVAVEKNIHAFLDLDIKATKVVIGDGPTMSELKHRYPETVFLGYKSGEDLARHIASADVMVFPSLTDTFGLVVLEGMACGVPVAAYPVTGPKDIIENGVNGRVDRDLAYAVEQSLKVPPQQRRYYAEKHSWQHAANQFESNLVPVNGTDARLQVLEARAGEAASQI